MSLTITDVFKKGTVYSASSVAHSQRQRMSREEEEKDILTLSSQARDFKTVFKTLSEMPDIREEKVLDLQNRINYGNYNVSSSDLASKILENM